MVELEPWKCLTGKRIYCQIRFQSFCVTLCAALATFIALSCSCTNRLHDRTFMMVDVRLSGPVGQSPQIRRSRRFHALACSWLFAILVIMSFASSYAEDSNLRVGQPVSFEIPAQPLAQALDSFSIASGIDVFYNAAMAERRRSMPVIGTFTPQQAIAIMLSGSGYVARVTAPGSIAIVNHEPGPAAAEAPFGPSRYEAYFSKVQARIDDVLCALPDRSAAEADMLLRIWLRPSGEVARAELLSADQPGKPSVNRLVADAISVAKFAAPPGNMPQPLTLVVLPPPSRGDLPCTSRGQLAGQAVR